VPIGSFIVATAPLDAALAARLMPGRRNFVTTRIIGNYFRLTRDNRLIFGGRAPANTTACSIRWDTVAMACNSRCTWAA
jgi:glycine/D-amino acid oxidase-like deaminating enzyme